MKKIIKCLGISLFALLCCINNVDAQFNVTRGANDSALSLTKKIIGKNISTTNEVRKGTVYTFSGGLDKFGIESGIILDTSGLEDESFINETTQYIDQDLKSLLENSFDSSATYNEEWGQGGHTSSLEFEMIANGKLLNFNYAFGSLEFDQSAQYNDIFGLFVSVNDGPYENIALIEKTDKTYVPVSITSLRAGKDGTEMENGTSQNLSKYTNHTLFTAKNESININGIDDTNMTILYDSVLNYLDNKIKENNSKKTKFEGYYTYLKNNQTAFEDYVLNNIDDDTIYDLYDNYKEANYVSINGISNVFNAQKEVSVGDKIKVKLVIADASDLGVDSYVFIEAESLSFEPKFKVNYPEDNMDNIIINNDTLNGAIPFTTDEETLIKKGTPISIRLIVKDAKDTISSQDKDLINSVLNNQKVIGYFDASLFKKVGNLNEEKLTTLTNKIKLIYQLEDADLNLDKSKNRVYKIIRVHDSKVDTIDTVFDENTKTLTFETDRFSSYALVYEDKDIVTTPETGDVIISSIAIGILSLVSYIGCNIYLNKKNN